MCCLEFAWFFADFSLVLLIKMLPTEKKCAGVYKETRTHSPFCIMWYDWKKRNKLIPNTMKLVHFCLNTNQTVLIRYHSFSTCGKFSRIKTFFTSCYAHVHMVRNICVSGNFTCAINRWTQNTILHRLFLNLRERILKTTRYFHFQRGYRLSTNMEEPTPGHKT